MMALAKVSLWGVQYRIIGGGWGFQVLVVRLRMSSRRFYFSSHSLTHHGMRRCTPMISISGKEQQQQ